MTDPTSSFSEGAAPTSQASMGGEAPPTGPVIQDPTQMVDQAKVVAEVREHYGKWKEQRRKHEGNWFKASAFLRGQQHVEYNEGLGQLVTPNAPTYRVRLDLNRIRPKIRARLSKFFKGRPRPDVLPASTNNNDVLNARATEKVLHYHWDRLGLESKYKDARMWACIGHKAYWWFSIENEAPARINYQDQVHNVMLPDVLIEVGSPFEVLVQDPAISRIGEQPAIQRIRLLPKEDIYSRYPQLAEEDMPMEKAGSTDQPSAFTDRIATLRQGVGSAGESIQRDGLILVIEEFTAPCGKYPKGRYVVVVGDRMARYADELPYGMFDHKANPYPVVEFTDSLTPGQFWGTTFVEQLIDLQRQYNYLFELITENVRAVARPKIVVYRQHNLADGAWTTAAGEVVELNWVPNLPPPMIVQPANVAGDCWNLVQYYDKMFDDLTQIYPAAEGEVAKSTSGFQTNLLQEATDSVHAPDVREDELTLQEAAWKIRRICKLLYDAPRMFSILGENSMPEVIEFGRNQIDEFAEVRIQAGSMLPDLKAARAQTAMDLYTKGIFGNPQDPLVRRRVLSLLDMAGFEVHKESERADTDEARLEEQMLSEGKPIPPHAFYQDAVVHLDSHHTYMKSPAFKQLADPQKQTFVAHVITTWDFVNPVMAQGLRLQFGMAQLPVATPPQPPPVAPLGAPAPQAEAPPPQQPAPPAPAPVQ